LKSIFNPPSRTEIESPRSSYISRLILEEPSSYWESGGGDAAIRYIDDNDHTVSEMIFLFRDSAGMFIQFFPANGSNTVLCNNPDDRQLENEITVMHCGSPLPLPRSYFVDRSTAAKAISTFIDHGTGEQPPGFNWIET
jgi:hypothetical protein